MTASGRNAIPKAAVTADHRLGRMSQPKNQPLAYPPKRCHSQSHGSDQFAVISGPLRPERHQTPWPMRPGPLPQQG